MNDPNLIPSFFLPFIFQVRGRIDFSVDGNVPTTTVVGADRQLPRHRRHLGTLAAGNAYLVLPSLQLLPLLSGVDFVLFFFNSCRLLGFC